MLYWRGGCYFGGVRTREERGGVLLPIPWGGNPLSSHPSLAPVPARPQPPAHRRPRCAHVPFAPMPDAYPLTFLASIISQPRDPSVDFHGRGGVTLPMRPSQRAFFNAALAGFFLLAEPIPKGWAGSLWGRGSCPSAHWEPAFTPLSGQMR